jgi:hypothetical protein
MSTLCGKSDETLVIDVESQWITACNENINP